MGPDGAHRNRERARGSGTRRNALAKHACTHSITYQHRAHTQPGQHHHPGREQMQRTGARERACGSGRGQHPLAEHAQHAPQPRSIAWGGGGEAAMKGGAPCFLAHLLKALKSNSSARRQRLRVQARPAAAGMTSSSEIRARHGFAAPERVPPTL